MSCSCGKGNFSSQKNTWSCKSNLDMASWDPYPELQNKKNCYGTNVENYCGCNGGNYNNQPNLINASYVPLQHSVLTSGSKFKQSQENYVQDPHCCGVTPYIGISKTWTMQKPYTL